MPVESAEPTPFGLDDKSARSWQQALWRGFQRNCPACGSGRIFSGYLSVNDHCQECACPLHHQRADDAPPYFTIAIVGHIIFPLLLALEKLYAPPAYVHFLAWIPLALIITFWLMPRIKGALIGLQWALRMHGFENPSTERP